MDGARVVAASEAALCRVRPGMALAEARAVTAPLRVFPVDHRRDMAALEALALWCGQYASRVGLDRQGGILLDIAGRAARFGGERAMLAEIQAHAQAWAIGVRLAIADRPARAIIWARHGAGGVLSRPLAEARLSALPLAALSLDGALIDRLCQAGFRRLGDLLAVTRWTLATRFSRELAGQIDALFGDDDRWPTLTAPPGFVGRAHWSEPAWSGRDVVQALDELIEQLAGELAHACRGARRIEVTLARIDGAVRRFIVAPDPAVTAAGQLRRLLLPRLTGVPHGVDLAIVAVTEHVQLRPARHTAELALAGLAERLGRRLGAGRLVWPTARSSGGKVPRGSGQ